jgi:hypothetical protein
MSNFWIEIECLDAASLQQHVSDLAALQYNWMEEAENMSSFRIEIDCLDAIHCSNTCVTSSQPLAGLRARVARFPQIACG